MDWRLSLPRKGKGKLKVSSDIKSDVKIDLSIDITIDSKIDLKIGSRGMRKVSVIGIISSLLLTGCASNPNATKTAIETLQLTACATSAAALASNEAGRTSTEKAADGTAAFASCVLALNPPPPAVTVNVVAPVTKPAN